MDLGAGYEGTRIKEKFKVPGLRFKVPGSRFKVPSNPNSEL
jgi:hypothetical protein